jgi:COMPASS component SWD3
MEDSDLESSRSPKRRRVNGNGNTPRYSSPDELAASSDHEASYSHPYHSRNTSNPKRDSGEREQHLRRSYDDSGSEGSPDELDHTIHTFYRGESWNRSQRQSRDKSATEERSIETPRSATPPRRRPAYVRYKQKMVLKGHRKGVAAVRFSPDGRMIASCCKLNALQGPSQ